MRRWHWLQSEPFGQRSFSAIAENAAKSPESKAFYDKKRAQGKTHNQTLRALGRNLVRVMWSMLKHGRDYQLASPSKRA